ncbi:MAG: hypothetical protein HC836_40570 [Richelia sp. RM2_1_2]|nr:hypothetical protein [Richelia sp. SM2_1_7]NJM22476.1 hypothetical protein [Richelia sp. SM1_7_0]NJN12787.1 hypothetical protein [Richelia sp. RM1_1_1]NJO31061.1 hypothetical protein [Richelia sp. SL_2_1]NJO64245.1 hypothetical protein [Richelia sp. RM2_1_2]
MNLPFILDIVLGLIFTYLILSLLASEIQELIATLLQWRAVHLRKSIEILLAGGTRNSEEAKIIQLVNQIYSNPLVKNINQEAKGFFATLPRKATWAVGSLTRPLTAVRAGNTNNETIFGDDKRSGPSYIPADIYATTLMETLQIPEFSQKLSESRLDKFKAERITEIQDILFTLEGQIQGDDKFTNSLSKIYQEFAEMQADLEQIIWNYHQNKATLNTSIARMAESIDRFVDTFQIEIPESEYSTKALRKLKFLRQDMFSSEERAITLGGLQPNVGEIVQLMQKGSGVYNEFKAAIKDKDSQTYQKFEQLTEILPESIAENLTVLAHRTQARIQSTESGINLLRQEMQNSFNSSMERASGVYKRNAKGVALLIGITMAVAANADAFHMISRLSTDSALRNTIVNNAGQIVVQNKENLKYVDIGTLRSQTEEALSDISLPIGWTEANIKQQIGLLPSPNANPMFFLRFARAIPGWILSGIAIAMGAPFWFDLIGKIANVRNTGKKP